MIYIKIKITTAVLANIFDVWCGSLSETNTDHGDLKPHRLWFVGLHASD